METPSTRRVRRDHAGGKRPEGRRLQRERRKIRRPDPSRIDAGPTDASLTGLAGLATFGAHLRRLGVDSELAHRFRRLKKSEGVVYPMDAQLRLLLDANVAGEERVFGVEALAGDPLFAHLSGGSVPSVDTLYRDLARFDAEGIRDLDLLVAKYGVAPLRSKRHEVVHLDIDTTVEVLFGQQEGARPGPNPRYHGRPSYHPILAYVAETGTLVGALLRPGDTGLGAADAPFIRKMIERVRAAAGPDCRIYVRIDGAGDCTEILRTIRACDAHFLVKAHMTRDLCAAIQEVPRWSISQEGADGKPSEQWADVSFARGEWHKHEFYPRVVALRSKERSGKQTALWEDIEWGVQAYLTSETVEPGADVARRYDGRAGIEPIIGELKYAWGIGKVPTAIFLANHAAFLLKLLSFNLLRILVHALRPALAGWRTPWIRRVLISIPGRLVRSGRRWMLRVRPAALAAAPSG